MAFNFPDAPSVDQVYGQWKWDGTAWVIGSASGQPAPVPSGGIIMWSGSASTIPSGWYLCDGQNGTPDLRDRFIMSSGPAHAAGTSGGQLSTDLTELTEAQMPKHYHRMLGPNSVSATQGPSDVYGVYGGGTPDDPAVRYGTYSAGGDAPSGGTATGTSNGDGHAHTFMPPYFSLCFIMRG